MPEHDASREGRAKFESSALPNIKTNPAKKGGFGVPGVTIGPQEQYESEPYDLARRQERVRTSSAKKQWAGAMLRSPLQ